jgi:hypothetical protein
LPRHQQFENANGKTPPIHEPFAASLARNVFRAHYLVSVSAPLAQQERKRPSNKRGIQLAHTTNVHTPRTAKQGQTQPKMRPYLDACGKYTAPQTNSGNQRPHVRSCCCPHCAIVSKTQLTCRLARHHKSYAIVCMRGALQACEPLFLRIRASPTKSSHREERCCQGHVRMGAPRTPCMH